MSGFYLPSKIRPYLMRLRAEYTISGRHPFSEILETARIHVVEAVCWSGWHDEDPGHNVKFFLPLAVLKNIRLEEQNSITEKIRKDLNICAKGATDEFFHSVLFELIDEEDNEYQQSFALSQQPLINPNTLVFWRPGEIRLFISHRDNHKVAAKSLANALKSYGISAFVAHDTIEPMTTWQKEIIKGLQTMEVMLAFITDDFDDSAWTNQEVGFALGRNIPVVSLKLEKGGPSGLIGATQALRGDLANPTASAPMVYRLLTKKLGNEGRMNTALITAFVQSKSYVDAKERFDRMSSALTTLSEDQIAQITRGFEENGQLYGSGYLRGKDRLKNFLEKSSSEKFEIHKNVISVKSRDRGDQGSPDTLSGIAS